LSCIPTPNGRENKPKAVNKKNRLKKAVKSSVSLYNIKKYINLTNKAVNLSGETKKS
jgi:hypothetical protein